MPLLVALALSAATTATPPAARPICPVSRIEHADARLKPHIAPLGAMPPAKQIIAVLRTIDRCEMPIVVHEEVGANRH